MGLSPFKSVSVTLVFRVVAVGLGVVNAIVLARLFGPAGRGVLTVVESLNGLLMVFAGQWLYNSNSIYAARDPRNVAPLARNSFVYSGIAGTVVALGVVYLYRQFDGLGLGNISMTYLVIALASIPAQFFNNACLGLLLGQKKTLVFNLLMLSQTVSYLFAIGIMFLVARSELAILLTIMTGIHFLLSAGLLLYYRHSIGFWPSFSIDWSLFQQSFQIGAKLFLTGFASYLVVRSDVFLVNFYKGEYQVGIYAVAVRLLDLLLILPNTVAVILLPHLSSEKNLQKRHTDTLRFARLTVLAFIGLSVVVLVAAPHAIPLLFGKEFEASYFPLALLLPGLVFLAVQMVLVQNLWAMGPPRGVVIMWLLGAVVNIALNLVWIPNSGYIGAALSSSVTYSLVAIGIIWVYKRNIGLRLRDLVKFEREDWTIVVKFTRRWNALSVRFRRRHSEVG